MFHDVGVNSPRCIQKKQVFSDSVKLTRCQSFSSKTKKKIKRNVLSLSLSRRSNSIAVQYTNFVIARDLRGPNNDIHLLALAVRITVLAQLQTMTVIYSVQTNFRT